MKSHEAFTFNTRQMQQLKKLVAGGEGRVLEFKRKAAYPEKVVREMIAFANTVGGILLVGVSDDGSIPGLKFPEDDAHVINEALKKCRPALPVKETFIPVGEKRFVIQYEIAESRKKPHYFLGEGHVREYYVRVEDRSIKASREVREISKRSRQKKGVRFHYGDHEHWLMQYLDENATITLKKFIELSGLKRFIASKKLVLLVLADILHITPHEKGDIYSLALPKD